VGAIGAGAGVWEAEMGIVVCGEEEKEGRRVELLVTR
jgi:hypothetical protein